ncbi:MAG: flagellar biosynthesis protein FlhF [Roseburia sp.]|nr:flagellar biosynthesis protein FlhF [Roseburia sp.]MCM1278027.1 flagellar biosynthesis protein FlhF [Robinsoniella sp.]
MIIKKFLGKTEEEAVENAKKELGTGIVIMNVKNVKKKGFFSLFQREKVEVTVALEEEGEKPKVQPKQQPVQEAVAKQAPKPAQAAPAEGAIKEDSAAIEEKLDSLQSLLEKQLLNAAIIDEKEKKEKEDGEEEEDSKEVDEMTRFLKLLYNTMIENEVDEIYANQIVDDFGKVQSSNQTIDFVLSNIYQKMILRFGESKGIEPPGKKPKLVFFIGPTGVGKTTTIAKLASQFQVEKENKVALLTADTYRIAAAEQLRTYANILEAPFRIIYTEEEIKAACEEFSGYDYILVDTAGHSHQNESQRENLKKLLDAMDDKVEKEVYLVLSATTKYRDLLNIADTYAKMTDYKIIFTKLDETETFGNLLNLKLHTGVELSYVTCGQNVPDDIADFNPQKTVKRLLEGRQ